MCGSLDGYPPHAAIAGRSVQMAGSAVPSPFPYILLYLVVDFPCSSDILHSDDKSAFKDLGKFLRIVAEFMLIVDFKQYLLIVFEWNNDWLIPLNRLL